MSWKRGFLIKSATLISGTPTVCGKNGGIKFETQLTSISIDFSQTNVPKGGLMRLSQRTCQMEMAIKNYRSLKPLFQTIGFPFTSKINFHKFSSSEKFNPEFSLCVYCQFLLNVGIYSRRRSPVVTHRPSVHVPWLVRIFRRKAIKEFYEQMTVILCVKILSIGKWLQNWGIYSDITNQIGILCFKQLTRVVMSL